MKVLAFTLFALVAVVTSRNINLEDVIDLEESSAYGYHRKFGISLADEIRETEARGESARIAGGSTVQLGWYPYHVGLVITLTNGGQSACGGALLNSRRVLTAAHCWWDGEKQGRQFAAVVGSLTLFSQTTGQRQTGSNVIMHASWNPSRLSNDIAMINLGSAFSFTNNIRPLALPSSGLELNSDYAGSTGTVTGFGRTGDTSGIPQNTVLRSVPGNVFANFMCRESFSSVTATQLCTRRTAGMSPCPGDSGGPLVVFTNNRYIAIGVVSFGDPSCTSGHPVVYTRVTSFINWITSRL